MILCCNAGSVANNGESSGEEPSAGCNLPLDGAEWVDLLVGEVINASNVEDAKVRVSRALEVLEKSIFAHANASAQNVQKVCSFIFSGCSFSLCTESYI